MLEEQVSGDATARYVWSPVYVDAMVMRDRDTDANGTLDERLWVQQDANGNVSAIINTSGVIVERYAYDPFGTITVYDAGYSVQSGGSNYSVVYGFQGLRGDPITGTLDARYRDYSPAIGRWTTQDPIKFKGRDVNLYRMVGNLPIGKVDPLGLAKFAIPVKIDVHGRIKTRGTAKELKDIVQRGVDTATCPELWGAIVNLGLSIINRGAEQKEHGDFEEDHEGRLVLEGELLARLKREYNWPSRNRASQPFAVGFTLSA